MINDVAYTSSLSVRLNASYGGGGTMISTPCGRSGCCLIDRLLGLVVFDAIMSTRTNVRREIYCRDEVTFIGQVIIEVEVLEEELLEGSSSSVTQDFKACSPT